jgi:hypothetical protein
MLGEASFSMVSEDLETAKIIYIYISIGWMCSKWL